MLPVNRFPPTSYHEFPVLMNGYKHVAAQMAAAWSIDEGADAGDQYSHILKEDNDGLVSALQDLLGSSESEVHEKSGVANPFGSSAGDFPWEAVANAKTGLEEFVRAHCDGLRTDETGTEE